MIKRSLVRSYVWIVAIFVFIHVLAFNIFGVTFSPIAITGKASVTDSAILRVGIERYNVIRIYSPENTTYNFNQGEMYSLPLNVSADFTADDWEYSLYDVEHSVYAEDHTPFTPNSSIVAVRWGNVLTVYAHEQDGSWHSNNVTFYVEVLNSAPILGNLSEEVLVCENDNLRYDYNATDIDEERLTATISNPNPFFTRFTGYDDNQTTLFEIVSIPLSKFDAGGVGGVSQSYEKTITVYDSEMLIDSGVLNITVIEVNDRPIIVNQLGAQTIWLTGENSIFSHQYNVTDIEDGLTVDENFVFNLSFDGVDDLFGIDSTNGSMYYEPVLDDVGNTYYLTACVEDNPMLASHENFSICEAGGETNESWVVCDTFSLTVTDENRAPQVINWTPNSLTASVGGTSSIGFFAEVYDPDGTVPDIDWYVDGILREHNENISSDVFSRIFGCGVGGVHEVEIFTTDGLLNDSVSWDVTVNYVACPEPSSGGGGGSGGGSTVCTEDWMCGDWDVCQNVKKSFDSGILSKEDYVNFKEVCLQSGYDDERFCGFQVTSCVDLNACNNSVPRKERPSEMQVCYYTENPSCYDKITNCHDGACESLVDCGGPCAPCPTCSDGIKNQGEEGIDCGGPCPFACASDSPNKWLTVLLIILSIILGIGIIYLGYRIFLRLRERYYSY